MTRQALLFVLAFPLALYIRPLRHDWRRGAVFLACVLGGFFVGALIAYPLQAHISVDALNLCGTTGVIAGILVGRPIAVRIPAEHTRKV